MPKVAIIYLCWSDEPQKYLVDALRGVAAQTYAKENLELVVVYNSHKQGEESAAQFIRKEISKLAGILPRAIVLEQEKNLGFSGGNNAGISWAAENGFDYIFLHNADGYLHETAIENLVSVMESDKTIGEAQPLILLHPEKNLVNSAGNCLHYLGMGYCRHERKPVESLKLEVVEDIGYVSGAACLLRVDLVKNFGPWKEIFFLYHEDTEYSLRLKFLGYRTVLASRAIFYHRYDFKRSVSKLFWMERNRHAIKYLFYKWPTLFLLLPIEIVYNCGLLLAATRGKWIGELLKVYKYWLNPKNWNEWLKMRREIQKTRAISDKELLKGFAVTVESGGDFVGRPMHKIANFCFTIYGNLVKILVKW